MEGIEIEGLKKFYGDTHALDGLDLVSNPGEVLGIAGPNGAGKSTLIKILAGETTPDAGEIRIDGEVWSPRLAAHKVAVVHQEPQLFPNLTVGQNLLVGREGTKVNRPHLTNDERRLLRDLEIEGFVNRPLETCTLAVQQRTEIARALVQDARCVLFDEPNSALTDEESAELFRHMRSLAEAGHVVILVSHRLAELVANSNRVAVIRDGRRAAVLEGEDLTQEAVAAELVVGRAERSTGNLEEVVSAHNEGGACLQLRQWTHRGGEFAHIELAVNAGEVVALIGVEGSGARELLRSVAGFEPATGSISIGDLQGQHALQSTVAYVAPDRRDSLFTNLTVGQNVFVRLGPPEIASPSGLFRKRRASTLALEAVKRFAIRCRSVFQPIRDLSGGNQQKVAIASAIVRQPRVLALEEPTRGVDIGSKGEIYQLLHQYAAEGKAVILFCTEVSEVFEAADRAYVVSDGRLSPSLTVAEYNDVEALARQITRLERHAHAQAAASA